MSAGTISLNVFDRLALAFGRALKAQPPPAALAPPPNMGVTGYLSFPGWDVVARDGAGDQNARDEATAKRAIVNQTVYACCQAIANELSVARLAVRRRTEGGEEEVDNHPLERLWEQPNPFMGRSALLAFWAWQILLSGEAYLYVYAPQGEPVELWPVPSWMIAPIPHPKRFIDGYMFGRLSDQRQRIDSKYIIYSRLTHPFDIRRGLSPLGAAMLAVDSDQAMASWNKNFFSRDNAAPTGVVSVPRDTLDNDLARIRMEMRDFFGQGQQRVAVARAGDLSWEAFDRSQKDMEFFSGRAQASRDILLAFGFPEGYFAKDATRANSEGAKATVIESAVWPRLVLLHEDLNSQFVPRWYGADLRVTFDDIRPRNRALELQEFGAWQAVLTVDELRELIQYEAIGDYRGGMLVKEVDKAAPMAGTPAALELEDLVSAMEAEAQSIPPPAGASETPPDAAPPAQLPPPDDQAQKALDRERWERKALKALKATGRADVRFTPDALTEAEAEAIRAALALATTPDAVRQACKAIGEDVDDVIDRELAAALVWAKAITEG